MSLKEQSKQNIVLHLTMLYTYIVTKNQGSVPGKSMFFGNLVFWVFDILGIYYNTGYGVCIKDLSCF